MFTVNRPDKGTESTKLGIVCLTSFPCRSLLILPCVDCGTKVTSNRPGDTDFFINSEPGDSLSSTGPENIDLSLVERISFFPEELLYKGDEF